ncbi:Aldehyde/histidinol dehydrogenase [Aspergillus desertorum]
MPSLASTLKDPALSSKELIGTCPESYQHNYAIRAAATAFSRWHALSGRQRGRVLRKWFGHIIENTEDIRKIVMAENGKAKGDAEAEALFSAEFPGWFSEEAARIYGDVIPHSNPSSRIQMLKESVGVCGSIKPWNFLMAMGARKVAAALAAGCTVVLKSHGLMPFSSNNTPALGLALCESDVEEDFVYWVNAMLRWKSWTWELGGNAPFIGFDDADLEIAAASVIASKFKLTGQTCVCTNRFFIQEGIYEAFSNGSLTNGLAKTQEHIQNALSQENYCVTWWQQVAVPGKSFHERTILGDVDYSMKVASEEMLGPLSALFKFKTEDEVAHRVSGKLELGMVAIDRKVISNYAAPFGEFKHSGMGREGSKYGIDDYVNIKMMVTGGINTVYSAQLETDHCSREKLRG